MNSLHFERVTQVTFTLNNLSIFDKLILFFPSTLLMFTRGPSISPNVNPIVWNNKVYNSYEYDVRYEASTECNIEGGVYCHVL